MAVITVNNYQALDLVMTQPRIGTWFADVQLIGAVDVSGAVVISDGTLPYNGTAIAGGTHTGRTYLRIVGGAGGLGITIKPKHYRAAMAGKIIGDICKAAGESKSLLIDPRLALKRLAFWTIPESTAGAALSSLAEALGCVWRVLPTGGVWFGDPDFAIPAPSEYAVLDRDPISRTFTVAVNGLPLMVGMTQSTGTITRIEYAIDSTARARYWVD